MSSSYSMLIHVICYNNDTRSISKLTSCSSMKKILILSHFHKKNNFEMDDGKTNNFLHSLPSNIHDIIVSLNSIRL
jgi:hypothetical protein